MKNCKRCEKIFSNNGKYEKFCMECRKPKGFIKGGVRGSKKICPVCKDEFVIKDYHRKYCSDNCFKDSKRKEK